MLPFGAPGHRTRAERFDDAVAGAVDRLTPRWGEQWGRLEFGTEDIPPSDPAPWEEGIALGRYFPADVGLPARVVLYRRPIEQRTDAAGLPGLVRDVVAEHVAHVVGRSPEEVDPEYGAP